MLETAAPKSDNGFGQSLNVDFYDFIDFWIIALIFTEILTKFQLTNSLDF